jgi:hypothetical protein
MKPIVTFRHSISLSSDAMLQYTVRETGDPILLRHAPLCNGDVITTFANGEEGITGKEAASDLASRY